MLNAVADLDDGGETATGRVYIWEIRADRGTGRWTNAYGLYAGPLRQAGRPLGDRAALLQHPRPHRPRPRGRSASRPDRDGSSYGRAHDRRHGVLDDRTRGAGQAGAGRSRRRRGDLRRAVRAQQPARARARGRSACRRATASPSCCRTASTFYALYFAAMQAGWYFTPINHHLVGPEIAYIVDDCEAKALIVDARFADAVQRSRPRRSRSPADHRFVDRRDRRASAPTTTSSTASRRRCPRTARSARRCTTPRAPPGSRRACAARCTAGRPRRGRAPHRRSCCCSSASSPTTTTCTSAARRSTTRPSCSSRPRRSTSATRSC